MPDYHGCTSKKSRYSFCFTIQQKVQEKRYNIERKHALAFKEWALTIMVVLIFPALLLSEI